MLTNLFEYNSSQDVHLKFQNFRKQSSHQFSQGLLIKTDEWTLHSSYNNSSRLQGLVKPYFLSVLGYHVNSVLASRWVHGKFLKATWSGELNDKCVQQLSISITTLQFFTTFGIKHSLVIPKV